MGGKLTFPGGGVYHATKHAVEALSDALRFEVSGFGVDVVVIEPGLIITEFGETAIDEHRATSKITAPTPSSTPTSARLTADAYTGPMARLGAGPEAVAGKIAKAIAARRPEHPLQGHRLGQAGDGDARPDDRPHVGPIRPLAVPTTQAGGLSQA